MNDSTRERIDKILRFGPAPREASDARLDDLPNETGRAALALVQRAAETLRAREERAQALTQQAIDELKAAEMRIRSLEARVLQAETRAKEAEKWLTRLHDSIHETLTGWQTDEARDRPRIGSAA